MMKGFYGFLIGVLVILPLSCVQAQEELLLDSFEGRLNSRSVDFGAMEGSFIKISASRELKVCGKQSMKLEYNLKPAGYVWAARGYNLSVKGAARWLVKPDKIGWGKYNAFSIHMYGSKSNAVIAFGIKDAKGEVWRFTLSDDFKGWKEIICPFSQFYVSEKQQPQEVIFDKILDFPVKAFLFEPILPSEGMYYFDCVKLIRVKEIPPVRKK